MSIVPSWLRNDYLMPLYRFFGRRRCKLERKGRFNLEEPAAASLMKHLFDTEYVLMEHHLKYLWRKRP
eukprot:scaffold1638_cov325-Chaetoceros_neogracile.AAC.6